MPPAGYQVSANRLQTKDFAGEDVETQTEQVMQNLEAVLTAAGCTFENVVKTTVLLADMNDFQKVNAVYGTLLVIRSTTKTCTTVLLWHTMPNIPI